MYFGLKVLAAQPVYLQVVYTIYRYAKIYQKNDINFTQNFESFEEINGLLLVSNLNRIFKYYLEYSILYLTNVNIEISPCSLQAYVDQSIRWLAFLSKVLNEKAVIVFVS